MARLRWWQPLQLRRPQVAVSVMPGKLRLLLARANGNLRPLHQLDVGLPEESVAAGLHSPNLVNPSAIIEALRPLAGGAGVSARRPGLVTLLLPDAAVRVALVPVAGSVPRRAEGESMARWALRGLLPVEAEEARVDWAVIEGRGSGGTPSRGRWLLAVGAGAEVIREYEGVVEALGWVAGRVVPWTLALAVGAEASQGGGGLHADSVVPPATAARLVLSGTGGHLACLVEADGVPRLHRAWRRPIATEDLAVELVPLQQYVRQRLGLDIVEATVTGPEDWTQSAMSACQGLGWEARLLPPWSALMGALRP